MCVYAWKRKKSNHMSEVDRRRKETSAVNVWCHFAVRGNSGVSNIGTHISAGKHLFNSHPFPDSSRRSKSWSERDFNLPIPSPFPSYNCYGFIRHFARTCLRTRDTGWRNAIQSKATHRVRTDVVVPINGLEAILFPMCVRAHETIPILVNRCKNKDVRPRRMQCAMHRRKSRTISILI